MTECDKCGCVDDSDDDELFNTTRELNNARGMNDMQQRKLEDQDKQLVELRARIAAAEAEAHALRARLTAVALVIRP